MDKEKFKQRTKTFALRIIRLVEALPQKQVTAGVIGKQLLRSGTSVGANYRAACRARSTAELIALTQYRFRGSRRVSLLDGTYCGSWLDSNQQVTRFDERG